MLERETGRERQELMKLLFKGMVKIFAKSQIYLTAFIVIVGEHSLELCSEDHTSLTEIYFQLL